MYDVLLGVPGCVTKCDRGRGSKLAKNSVTYFMDGPCTIKSFFPKKVTTDAHVEHMKLHYIYLNCSFPLDS